MKRVLYVVPGLNTGYKDGALNRVNSFINCFSQNGYKVYVLALPYYNNKTTISNKKDAERNTRWIVFPLVFFLHNRYINLLPLCVYKFIIMLITLFCRCNIVLADYELGAELTRWTKIVAKQIVNHRGDSIDEAKCLNGYDDNDNYIKNLKYYLRRATKSADISICVSKNLCKQITEYTGNTPNNTYIFPCCADISRFKSVTCPDNAEKIILGYFGGFNKWQCIDKVLDIFIKLRNIDKRFYLMLITNSSPEPYKEKLTLIGEENYLLRSAQRDEMPSLISKMDVSFAIREERPLNNVSSPTKLSESLMAGVPIIVTKASGDYADMYIKDRNAYLLDKLDLNDKDIKGLYDYCLYVHSNRQEIFNICRESVKERTWNNYVNKFHQFITEKL